MITKRSALNLNEFAVVASQYTFETPNENVDIKKLFDEYPVDVDYTIANSEDELNFQLHVKVSVNNEHVLKGYKLIVEGVGFFKFPKSATIEEKRNLINFSGISICINSIRGYISSMTSHGPMGRYLLPSIDINHLLKMKADTLETKPSKKKK